MEAAILNQYFAVFVFRKPVNFKGEQVAIGKFYSLFFF